MDFGIRGRSAVIAAGTAGLGLGAAKALAAEGVHVMVCGRNEDRLHNALKEIGHDALGVQCDVSSVEGARQFMQHAVAELGHIDILIANGGGPPAGGFAHTEFEAYSQALQQNLLSVVAMCHEVIPGMQERKWGRIVAITSVAVRQPIDNLILSNTARAGVTGFLKTLAREVAKDGITVNTVQPGTHETDRITQLYGGNLADVARSIPAGFIGDADDFGKIAAFLCSDAAKFMTGVQLHVDGGAYAGLQ